MLSSEWIGKVTFTNTLEGSLFIVHVAGSCSQGY